ncbi:hypothetical protein [Streptomyces sp. JJ36]|uniref:hypothetical protein n=1 Tax=Streptomyces sp. JJ36 TaxID=2736645 RepID=UPI001F1EE5EE|nr:hypothetical protein [Streptomyces sp. JJ36]MCF6525563.1 hypothetical protein [Streptomyces sp. JJ36]
MPGIDECLFEAMALPGARGASVVEWTSGLSLGTIGRAPGDDPERTAAETAELARMAAEHPSFAPTGPGDPAAFAESGASGSPGGLPGGAGAPGAAPGPVEDVIVATRTCYHVLRYVDTAFDSGVFLHLWLDRGEGNLAMARLRLRDLSERLTLA